MAIKAIEGVSGCYAKALDDEPIFVLLARDPKAPELVRQWSANRLAQIKNGGRDIEDLEQVREAQQCADNMEAWREINVRAHFNAPSWKALKPKSKTS